VGEEVDPQKFGKAFAEFVREIASTARAESPLLDRLTEHLGANPAQLPVTGEQYDTFDAPNLQLAIEEYLKRDRRSADLVGVAVENKRFMAAGLSELVSHSDYRPGLAEGPVDFVNFHLAGDRVLPCVNHGLYVIKDGDRRLVALVMGPSELGDPRRQRLHLEVMAARTEDAAPFIAEISNLMDRLNVYRGHVIRLEPGMYVGPGQTTLVQFQSIPRIAEGDVVLPPGVLERIERQTISFSRHAERLRASGRSLKRGVLLYGLPGTGKTLTIMYLAGRMQDRTVLIMTGRGLGLIETVAKMARKLAPAMVVMEDVDLVAEERTMPGFRGAPFLFELLNEMDGLRDDQDVIFVLTTNRAELLEPALAARPGRVDLVVELPLPDQDGRRRLIELYARGLELHEVDIPALVGRTEGATPAYIKELLRKSTLHALEDGDDVVRQTHVDAALEEMGQGGRLAERILGFRPEEAPSPPHPGMGQSPAGIPTTGFPVQAQVVFRKKT
jgi:hypothetical protein